MRSHILDTNCFSLPSLFSFVLTPSNETYRHYLLFFATSIFDLLQIIHISTSSCTSFIILASAPYNVDSPHFFLSPSSTLLTLLQFILTLIHPSFSTAEIPLVDPRYQESSLILSFLPRKLRDLQGENLHYHHNNNGLAIIID